MEKLIQQKEDVDLVWNRNDFKHLNQELAEHLAKIEAGEVFSDNDDGAFSDIYFYENLAIKHTVYWEADNVSEYLIDLDLELQSDHTLLLALQHSPYVPRLHCYNSTEDFVVMDKMVGPNLMDHLLLGNPFDKNIVPKCLEFLESVIRSGYFPIDFRFRCIYPFEESGLKIIDFNLYQTLDLLLENDYREYDLSLPAHVLAKKILKKIYTAEMSYIHNTSKYYKKD